MTLGDTENAHRGRRDRERVMEALFYQAPFLIEKLLKERIVETEEEGQALFAEVIKYFILNRLYPAKKWDMRSRLVDEVWHQFVLFTTEYHEFSQRYFGLYLHHAPGNSPSAPQRPPAEVPSAAEYAEHYQTLFGTPPPSIWQDRRALTLQRRILLRRDLEVLSLVSEEDSDLVTIVGPRGPIASINELARCALEFILRVKVFYVRELPGGLTDEEKLGLVEFLLGRMLSLGV
jgi:hypothetical protein